jgi:hypothetical protein
MTVSPKNPASPCHELFAIIRIGKAANFCSDVIFISAERRFGPESAGSPGPGRGVAAYRQVSGNPLKSFK